MRLGFHGAEPADPGVVDQNVEPAEASDGFVHERLNREMIPHIGDKRMQGGSCGSGLGERRLRLAQMIGIDARDRHVHALAQKRGGNRPPDSPRSARHDCDLALERCH